MKTPALPRSPRSILSALAALALVALPGCGADVPPEATGLAGLPAPVIYSFVAGQSAVLPGKESTDPTDEHDDPNGGVVDTDTLGPVAVATLWSGKTYYRNGKYNDLDWPVTLGTLSGAPDSVVAFEVKPAEQPASKWAASKHGLFFRFTAAVDHRVYRVSEGKLVLAAQIPAGSIDPAGWTRLGKLHISAMKAPVVFAVAPANLPLGPDKRLSDSVSGSNHGDTPLGTHVQLKLTTPEPPVDSLSVFKGGPADHANRYGQNRRFWPVTEGGRHGIVWQAPTSGEAFVTWLSPDLTEARSVALAAPQGFVLAGATSDDAGALFVLYIQASKNGELSTRKVQIDRLRVAGEGVSQEASANLDAAKKGLNITVFGTIAATSNQVAMRYSAGHIGVLLARKMHKANDGLNHQGAISFVLDAESLAVLKNHGQSSGHSFESFLTVASDGRFLGVDLGDNYPRGVHLHRFDAEGRKSRVVYTFKTKHGASPKSPSGKSYPVYEGAGGSKTLYQWSNDNSTYTELGGVVETSAGHVVVFASEADRLVNGKAAALHNAPRDLGAVLVRKDFEAASKGKSGNWVTDDLVLSKSDYTMEGGYFGFNGKWREQRNAGVLWHTAYADKEHNASRVKVASLPGKPVVVLWERWGPKSYDETFAAVLGEDGALQTAPVSLGKELRLGRREDPFRIGEKLACVRGDGEGLVLDVFLP